MDCRENKSHKNPFAKHLSPAVTVNGALTDSVPQQNRAEGTEQAVDQPVSPIISGVKNIINIMRAAFLRLHLCSLLSCEWEAGPSAALAVNRRRRFPPPGLGRGPWLECLDPFGFQLGRGSQPNNIPLVLIALVTHGKW